MMRTPLLWIGCCAVVFANGCGAPYYTRQGTGIGALGGAGVGALVGSASGHTGTGALIGAGVGALTGNVIGSSLDEIDARNREEIASQLGRPVAQGSATPAEVVAMTRGGVNPQLIIGYVNNSGVAQPISPQDVIYLSQQGVAPEVIQAMQTPRMAQAPPTVIAAPPPGPVIVEEYSYGPPVCYPACHHRPWGPGPRVGVGVSF